VRSLATIDRDGFFGEFNVGLARTFYVFHIMLVEAVQLPPFVASGALVEVIIVYGVQSLTQRLSLNAIGTRISITHSQVIPNLCKNDHSDPFLTYPPYRLCHHAANEPNQRQLSS
jgi:hypothetical protein